MSSKNPRETGRQAGDNVSRQASPESVLPRAPSSTSEPHTSARPEQPPKPKVDPALPGPAARVTSASFGASLRVSQPPGQGPELARVLNVTGRTAEHPLRKVLLI